MRPLSADETFLVNIVRADGMVKLDWATVKDENKNILRRVKRAGLCRLVPEVDRDLELTGFVTVKLTPAGIARFGR